MSLVHLMVDNGVAVLTLDNPPLNLISRRLTHELGDALASLEANRGVGAVRRRR